MRKTRRHSRLVLATTVVAAVLSGACSKDPSPAQPASSAAAAESTAASAGPSGRQALPACSIVSIAEVESTLGVQGLKGPEVDGEWPVRRCAFTAPPLNLPTVTIRFEVDRDAADFATIRKNHEGAGQPTTDFPGLGDAAATVSMGGTPLGITLLYKKTVVFVTTLKAPIDKQVALARVVMQRM